MTCLVVGRQSSEWGRDNSYILLCLGPLALCMPIFEVKSSKRFLGSKKFPGKEDGSRVRIDSVSQITGVRFDDPN